MRRQLLALMVAGALAAPVAVADPETFSALSKAGIEMSEGFAAAIAGAEGDELVALIVELVEQYQDNPAAIAAIIEAAVGVNPGLAQAIVASASSAAPQATAAIAAAAARTQGGAPTRTPRTGTGGGGNPLPPPGPPDPVPPVPPAPPPVPPGPPAPPPVSPS